MLHVEQGGNTHLLHFFVMKAVMRILGKSSSVGMKLVQILDCDSQHRNMDATKSSGGS